MGIERLAYLFIGRTCTDEEAKTLHEQILQDENTEELWRYCSFDDFSDLTLDGNPVVMHYCGVQATTDIPGSKYTDFNWYVVQHYISVVDDNSCQTIPFDYARFPAPQDQRYGLLCAIDVSC